VFGHVFAHTGTLCLTGSYDGTVRVWRVSDGVCLQTLEGPEDVEFAEWHSKGNAIVAGSKGTEIMITCMCVWMCV
jgi:WD40 repeat protein